MRGRLGKGCGIDFSDQSRCHHMELYISSHGRKLNVPKGCCSWPRGVMYTVYTCIPGVYLYTYTPPTTAVYQLYTWQGRVHMRGWCIPVYLSQQYTARYTGIHRPAGPRYTAVPTTVVRDRVGPCAGWDSSRRHAQHYDHSELFI